MAEDIKKKTVWDLQKTKLLVLTGLLFAISIVLIAVENSLPPIFPALPGIKLGLSNIMVMYTLFFLNRRQALLLALIKAVFVYATRGTVAGILSLSGGLLSLAVMILLLFVFKDKVSYLLLSIFGAIFHNLGQLTAVSLIYTNLYMLAYLPVLLFAGIIAGIATAALLKLILPALKKLS